MRRFFDEYRHTWRSTGSAGRRFLIGGLIYVARGIGFSVAFPLFAQERGYDSREIGLLVALAALTLFLVGAPIIWLGGRGWSTRLLVLGPMVSALGLILIVAAPADATSLVRLGAVLSGCGSATFWILGDPLLAQTTPERERARVYALKFFMLTLGISLGGGLGGWIPGGLAALPSIDTLQALTITLLVFAVADLLQAVIFWPLPIVRGTRETAASGSSTRHDRHSSRYIWFVMIALAIPELGMSIGHNSIRPFLSLFFTDQYDLSSATTGTLLALMALAGGSGALGTPRLAARIGNISAIATLRSLGVAMIILFSAGLGLGVVCASMLIYYSVMDGTEATFITETMGRMPAEHRTLFSGTYAMAWSLASSLASLASGAIQDNRGGAFGLAFLLGAAGYLFSVIWMVVVFPRLPTLHVPIVSDDSGSDPSHRINAAT